MNRWWESDSSERYWLEITDRDDLGANLQAPQTKDDGREFWSYSLVEEVCDGDIVFHYARRGNDRAIVASSVATGKPRRGPVVWAAKGKSAQRAGVTPYERPGFIQDLASYRELSTPVSLSQIRLQASQIDGVRAELENRFGPPVYFPFQTQSGQLRASQGYLVKLPRAVIQLFPQLEEHLRETMVHNQGEGTTAMFGAAYRPADESASPRQADPFVVDPKTVERGLRGHASTQNRLEAYIRSIGYSPRSPLPSEPNYDLAWKAHGVTYVAEVKSLTSKNQEHQLRLGLGQVLRYRHQLEASGHMVRAVLAVEIEPSDPAWSELCAKLGVGLVWPETFKRLGEHHE